MSLWGLLLLLLMMELGRLIAHAQVMAVPRPTIGSLLGLCLNHNHLTNILAIQVRVYRVIILIRASI